MAARASIVGASFAAASAMARFLKSRRPPPSGFFSAMNYASRR
jgi:hypothetical protein